MQAAAALGNGDFAQQCASKLASLLCPYLEDEREQFEQSAAEQLEQLRNIKFRFRRAPDLKEMPPEQLERMMKR